MATAELNFGESHASMPWFISCASSVINYFTVDTDGKTARERCRGRKLSRQLPEFRECVLFYKVTPKKQGEQLGAIWKSGAFLGINEVSQELII